MTELPEVTNVLPSPEYTEIDGVCTIKKEVLEALIQERNQYHHDIVFTTAQIKQLLTDLGLINTRGEFEFKMSALTRSLQTVIFQPKKAETKFNYLGSLQDIVVKYGSMK